ncbi:50S ribosomal protein L10 [Patescibacteria group bacterium]|nr:50S ribosomal protein L10 [Patescibacteria group bacterium]
MPLTKSQKTEILDALKNEMQSAKAVVFADYRGLSVKELAELRAQMRAKGVKYKVAKKTLIKLAAKELGFEDIPSEVLEGPVGVAFGMEDEISAAKLLHAYAKKHPNIKLRGALFEGKILSVAETAQLAIMPGKEELLGKLVMLLNSPISGFHGVLNNTVSGFVRVLNAIKEKQEQSA